MPELPVLPEWVGFVEDPPSAPPQRIEFADPEPWQPALVEFADPVVPSPLWFDFEDATPAAAETEIGDHALPTDAVAPDRLATEPVDRVANAVEALIVEFEPDMPAAAAADMVEADRGAAQSFDGFAPAVEVPLPAAAPVSPNAVEPADDPVPASEPAIAGLAADRPILPAVAQAPSAERGPAVETDAEPEARRQLAGDEIAASPDHGEVSTIAPGDPAPMAAIPAPGAPATPASRPRGSASRRRAGTAAAVARRLKPAGLGIVILVALAALRVDQMPGGQAPPRPPIPAAAPPVALSPIVGSDPLEQDAQYLERARAGDAQAQYRVAMIYAKGVRHNQDLPRAVEWFRKAAAAGVADAQYNLATLYERGLGVPLDMPEALNWYRRAAAHNHPFAEHNLAVAYAQGRGTPQNLPLAAKLFQQAAEQGIVPAMVNLAILYQQGKGVAASLVDSFAWYRAAGQRGDADAEKRAAAMFGQFSETDRPLAQAIAVAVAERIHEVQPPPGTTRDADRPIPDRIEAAPVLASGLGAPLPAQQDLVPLDLETAAGADANTPPAARSRFTRRQPYGGAVELKGPQVRW